MCVVYEYVYVILFLLENHIVSPFKKSNTSISLV